MEDVPVGSAGTVTDGVDERVVIAIGVAILFCGG